MLIGSPLVDNLRGSSGRDTLDGGFGADDISGGSSTDTLVYSGRASGVNVTIGSGNFNDGGPEDQTGSRRDKVHGDVEVLFGTDSADVLVGDHSSETLVGLAGDDFSWGKAEDFGRGRQRALPAVPGVTVSSASQGTTAWRVAPTTTFSAAGPGST